MAKKKTDIKLIENNTDMYYRVTVDGKDVYSNFTFTQDPDSQTDARRTAKAAAFDEIASAIFRGENITVNYLSH